MSERCEQTSERTSWVARYLCPDSWLFWTAVHSLWFSFFFFTTIVLLTHKRHNHSRFPPPFTTPTSLYPVLKTGSSGLVAYRWQTKDVRWQWLQTSMRVVYKNNKPDYVLCTHRPLTEDEGRDLYGKRGQFLPAPYLFPVFLKTNCLCVSVLVLSVHSVLSLFVYFSTCHLPLSLS